MQHFERKAGTIISKLKAVGRPLSELLIINYFLNTFLSFWILRPAILRNWLVQLKRLVQNL